MEFGGYLLKSSLPTRECGLKSLMLQTNLELVQSLPTRECGLKYYYNTIENMLTSSHSLRGSVDWNFWVQVHVHGAGRHSLRGSVDWNWRGRHYKHGKQVTPYAGVWIEISTILYLYLRSNSHSLRGSVDWNLKKNALKHINSPSLPTRECGLKYLYIIKKKGEWKVTPYAGVWIEIVHDRKVIITAWSLPTRECGLKYH